MAGHYIDREAVSQDRVIICALKAIARAVAAGRNGQAELTSLTEELAARARRDTAVGGSSPLQHTSTHLEQLASG